jgi:hypothetical protein
MYSVVKIVTRTILYVLVLCAAFGVLIWETSSLGLETPKWAERYLVFPLDAGVDEHSTSAEKVLLNENAVRADPATPSRWCDLAEAYQDAGKGLQAEAAMDRAVQLGGSLPPILMRAVNLSFRQGDHAAVMRRAARVLDLVGVYDDLVFVTYRRMGLSVSDVLSHGLPETGRAYESYFRHLLRNQDTEGVGLSWAALGEKNFQTVELCGSCIDYLIKLQLYDKSAQAWAGCKELQETPNGENPYLYNGKFERDFSGVAFDWRIRPIEGVSVRRDADPRGDGFSLRLDFSGERNLVYRHVQQLAYLPAGRYRLRTTARVDGLTTDRGVYLAINDVDTGRECARTEELRGTGDWWELSAEFAVPEDSALMRVSVCRDESLRIDSKISGTVWLDDVVLEKR